MSLIDRLEAEGVITKIWEERFTMDNPDPVMLAADLSHQLEEALAKISMLEKANLEWSIECTRHKAVVDAFKQLILDLHYRGD